MVVQDERSLMTEAAQDRFFCTLKTAEDGGDLDASGFNFAKKIRLVWNCKKRYDPYDD